MTRARSPSSFGTFTLSGALWLRRSGSSRKDASVVRIRLYRGGAKKRPHYRIVAVDSRTKRDGRVLEFLGTYDPLATDSPLHLRRSALEAWVAKGARVSHSVASLMRRAPSDVASGDAADAVS